MGSCARLAVRPIGPGSGLQPAVARLPPQNLLQRGARAGKPRTHGPDRDAERFGDLAVLELLEIGQHNDDPVFLGQGRLLRVDSVGWAGGE